METTTELLAKLAATLAERYENQLAQFGPPRTPAIKRERAALVAGYKDGLQAGMHHVCGMLGVTIKAQS